MTPLLFSFASFFSTTFGGLLALRLRDKLRYVMGFTAGVLIALVAFDLLPEIFRQAQAQHLDPVSRWWRCWWVTLGSIPSRSCL